MLPFGGSWTTSTDLSDPSQSSDLSQIAMNPSGYAAVVWTNETLTQIQATNWLPAPAVTNVNPNRGSTAGGNTVTITGTNFCGVTSVKFGANNAETFMVTSGTTIKAIVPPGAPGTVDVTVTTGAGTSPITPNDHYTYLAIPMAPKEFHGRLIRKYDLEHDKNFAMHTWWNRNKSLPTVAFYKIYEDNRLIQVISVKKKPRFRKHVHTKHHLHKRYQITAVSTDGIESAPTKLKIIRITED